MFICRFWYVWLRARRSNQARRKQRTRNFITEPALFSTELNAHALLFFVLLVLEKQMPAESLIIYLFSSQPCENVCRSARSLTGTFSSMTNFSIYQFLKKSQKVCILNSIKTQEQLTGDPHCIKFPTHRKQQQNPRQTLQASQNLNQITIATIEEVILDSYSCAISFMDELEMSASLKSNKVYEMNDLCQHIRDHLQQSTNTTEIFDFGLGEAIKHQDGQANIIDRLVVGKTERIDKNNIDEDEDNEVDANEDEDDDNNHVDDKD